MRRLSDISERLVPVNDYWWGQLFWIDGPSLGFEVRRFNDRALQAGYASLLGDAFVWGHMDPFASQILVVEPPEEVGEDFVMVARYAGINIRHFYPELTDEPVEAPTGKLALLHDTVERLRVEAESPADKFIAELVAKRVSARDHHLVYGLTERDQRFHLADLNPDKDELSAWLATPRNPTNLP
jgi:hypothetical protein